MKIEYNNFANFYDQVMGSGYIEIYLDLIKKGLNEKNIINKKILDLGCGTGTLLSKLSSKNETYGIDASKKMLAVAKKKDKKTIYRKTSMQSFKGKESFFDIIICAFDTINHLRSFREWKKVFNNVNGLLAKDGMFIFDFNTLKKFKNINGKTLFLNLDRSYMFMETNLSNNKCYWDVYFFKKNKGNKYQLLIEKIEETSYEKEKILNELRTIFRSVKIVKNLKEERVFVLCKK